MNNKSIIAMALIAVAIMTTTSVAYADPNWHELVLELQSDLAALTTNVDSDISGLDARLTALESQSSAFIPSLYFVAVSNWTIGSNGGASQTTDPTEVFRCDEGDIELDLVTYEKETYTNSIGNLIEDEFLYSPEFVIQRTDVDGQLNQHYFMMGDWDINTGLQIQQLYIRCLDVTP